MPSSQSRFQIVTNDGLSFTTARPPFSDFRGEGIANLLWIFETYFSLFVSKLMSDMCKFYNIPGRHVLANAKLKITYQKYERGFLRQWI